MAIDPRNQSGSGIEETDVVKNPTGSPDSPRATSESALPGYDDVMEPFDFHDEEVSMRWAEPGGWAEPGEIINYSHTPETKDKSPQSTASQDSSLDWEVTHNTENFDRSFERNSRVQKEKDHYEFDTPPQPVWQSSSDESSPELDHSRPVQKNVETYSNSSIKDSPAEMSEGCSQETIFRTIPVSCNTSCERKSACSRLNRYRGALNTSDMYEMRRARKKHAFRQEFIYEEASPCYSSEDIISDWDDLDDCTDTDEKILAEYNDALVHLLDAEKQSRDACDIFGMERAWTDILELCYVHCRWGELCNQIATLSGNRSQNAQVIVKIFHKAVKYVDMAPSTTIMIDLIETLLSVCIHKIPLELENARLVRRLATLSVEQGFTNKAASMILEINADQILGMPYCEKVDYTLFQAFISLENKDYGLAHFLIFIKMNPNLLLDDSLATDVKLHYCELMIRCHVQKKEIKKICWCYLAMYKLPGVKDDPATWTPILRKICWFLMITPKDPEVMSLMNATINDENASSVACLRCLVQDFCTPVLIDWQKFWAFAKALLASEKLTYSGVGTALRERVIEHNISVLKTFYSRIRIQRLADLLHINVQETESRLCSMVETKSLRLKIDRPTGVVIFQLQQDVNCVLNTWASKLEQITLLLDKICGEIDVEMFLHRPYVDP